MTRSGLHRSVSEDNMLFRKRRSSIWDSSNSNATTKQTDSISSTSENYRIQASSSSFQPSPSNIRIESIEEVGNIEGLTGFVERYRFGINIFLAVEVRDRGACTMSPDHINSWPSHTERKSYLRLLFKNRMKTRTNSLRYVNWSESMQGGRQFLRALAEIWDKGSMVFESIRTRLHDIDDFDINAADVFFLVLDTFVMWYYRNSTSPVEARETVVKYHEKVRFHLRKWGTRRDMFTTEALLLCAERARTASLNVAEWEAIHGAAQTNNESSMWSGTTIADRLASFILCRGLAVDGDVRTLARRYIGEMRGAGSIDELAMYFHDIENIASAFFQADMEYRMVFCTRRIIG